jgi:hypothetical protein
MPWQKWNLGRSLYLAELGGIAFFWIWYGALLLHLPPAHRLMYFVCRARPRPARPRPPASARADYARARPSRT